MLCNFDETNFLILILSRLIQVDGQLQIIETKVNVEANISIKDVTGKRGEFTPVAIIHHTGQVTANTTRGHYQADVLQEATNTWFRTSDDDLPVQIGKKYLSEKGYIYLYKKLQK